MSRWVPLLALAVCLFGASSAYSGAILSPQPAPEWDISEWINGDQGRLKDHQGKVVVIEFFQLWCPGCNQFSIPLFKRWHEEYADRDDIVLLSIHTVFEGHDYQTPERLRQFVIDNGIRHPVGIDAYSKSDPENPVTMSRFRTGGTPHVAIVDKAGLLRFSHFGAFETEPVEAFITRLLKESSTNTARSSSSKPSQRKAQQSKSNQRGQTPRNRQAKDPRSGTYKIRLEQLDKSCGNPRPPINFAADVKIRDSTIDVTFGRRFLGLNKLTLEFDSKSGIFEFDGREAGRDRQAVLDLGLTLDGSFHSEGDKQELEFKLQFDKTADNPGWECEIEAKGTGSKV